MRPFHTLPFACALLCISAIASAQTLLIDRVRAERPALPARGASSAEVEARLGAPREKLERRGGQRAQWPSISRWVYPDFTVYLEKGRVIDVVATRASAQEIGPRPAIR